VADEHMIGRQSAFDLEERTAAKVPEVEARAEWAAYDPSGQAVVDASAGLEMAQERNCIA
jgi:hypothetical protein